MTLLETFLIAFVSMIIGGASCLRPIKPNPSSLKTRLRRHTMPRELNDTQLQEKAFDFAAALHGIPISQALYILKELTPQLITSTHSVEIQLIADAKEPLSFDETA